MSEEFVVCLLCVWFLNSLEEWYITNFGFICMVIVILMLGMTRVFVHTYRFFE